MAPEPPAGRRSVALRVSLIVLACFVLCGTPAVWAFVRIAPALTSGTPSRPVGSADSVSATPTSVRSPQPGDPPSVRAAWMRAQIDTSLTTQATALLKGDEKAFVATGEASNASVREKLTTHYRGLRALKITKWAGRVTVSPEQVAGTGSGGEWKAKLSFQHCFVTPTCEVEELRIESRWVERGGHAYLSELSDSSDSQNGPRPWEVSDLKVAVGKRVVMATTAKYSARLSSLLSEADKAAAVADRYSVGSPPPDRYRVYFAGTTEWKTWYGGDRPTWAAGYAVPTSQKRIDVVLNATETPASFIDDILRHELSHVAALRGASHQGSESWWLIEGLAEQAEMNGRPVGQHDSVASGALRTFVRSGNWNNKVALTEPADSANLKDAGARYGVAFLGVRRLVERFGETKVLAFFKAVVHDGKALPEAAQSTLGAQWTAVEADCVSYIKRTAG
jgi:hypothetical protein